MPATLTNIPLSNIDKDFILQEDGSFILQENENKIILEQSITTSNTPLTNININ